MQNEKDSRDTQVANHEVWNTTISAALRHLLPTQRLYQMPSHGIVLGMGDGGEELRQAGMSELDWVDEFEG